MQTKNSTSTGASNVIALPTAAPERVRQRRTRKPSVTDGIVNIDAARNQRSGSILLTLEPDGSVKGIGTGCYAGTDPIREVIEARLWGYEAGWRAAQT